MESWGTLFVTFLLGVATGAGGNYLASKYTDKRREKEGAKRAKEVFGRVKSQMPELIAEMKADFSKEEDSAIREFVILPNERVLFNSRQPRFSYYADRHSNFRGKIAILENT
jgi:hypothetical protein